MLTAKPTNNVKHVDLGDFHNEVLQSEVPVLVDFYADWCGPCKALAPVLEEYARQTPNTKVVKVNVDRNPELASRYRIDSIPSLLAFRDGRSTARHTGLANKAILDRLISQ
jgi:thioredoxin 1